MIMIMIMITTILTKSSTVGSFKKELKTHLFKLAYDVKLGFLIGGSCYM